MALGVGSPTPREGFLPILYLASGKLEVGFNKEIYLACRYVNLATHNFNFEICSD